MLYLILKTLAVPPGTQVVLGLCGLACYRRWPRLAILLLTLCVLSLWLLATPYCAGALGRLLEYDPVIDIDVAMRNEPEAIVVLGGGSYCFAPEFSGYDEVSTKTLERLRYAARLQRLTGLPLAVTGGYGENIGVPEGVAMTTVLEADLGATVGWAEVESRNTEENARFSARQFPFRRIVLVTHAVHMPRATRAFRDAGFEVTPAPMGFISRPHAGGWALLDFVPDIKSLWQSSYAVYEMVGALWYALRYGASSPSLAEAPITRARKLPRASRASTSSAAARVVASRTMAPSGVETMA